MHASPYRYHAAYIGACVLANSPGVDRMKITKSEWQTNGAKALTKWTLWIPDNHTWGCRVILMHLSSLQKIIGVIRIGPFLYTRVKNHQSRSFFCLILVYICYSPSIMYYLVFVCDSSRSIIFTFSKIKTLRFVDCPVHLENCCSSEISS